ncbi:hypothetical protein BC830DRAFT_503084 [Chytriomyces sp. MP71]|nr:hypothetical protein BC830DRAFT_503084 [Chytriomyces sp. MP71]
MEALALLARAAEQPASPLTPDTLFVGATGPNSAQASPRTSARSAAQMTIDFLVDDAGQDSTSGGSEAEGADTHAARLLEMQILAPSITGSLPSEQSFSHQRPQHSVLYVYPPQQYKEPFQQQHEGILATGPATQIHNQSAHTIANLPAPQNGPQQQNKVYYQPTTLPRQIQYHPYGPPSVYYTNTQLSAPQTPPPQKQFNCTIEGCGKIFFRKHHLVSHLVSHTEEKPFKCTLPGCDGTFRRNQDLRRHLRKVKHDQIKAENAQGLREQMLLGFKLIVPNDC